MKKTIFALCFFFLYLPATFAGKVPLPFFDDLQLHYVHSNEDKKVSGSSTESHLKDKKYHYIYTKVYRAIGYINIPNYWIKIFLQYFFFKF